MARFKFFGVDNVLRALWGVLQDVDVGIDVWTLGFPLVDGRSPRLEFE